MHEAERVPGFVCGKLANTTQHHGKRSVMRCVGNLAILIGEQKRLCQQIVLPPAQAA
jgi:hypothetical protein